MLKILKKKSNLVFLILSVILIIPALMGLLNQGFPLTDDGNWMVIRFSAFYEALREGQFPVRFLTRLNNGFGYPVADFLYPLFMYIGTPIHVLGFSFTNTIKLIFGLSLVFSSLFAFLWLRKIFDNISSLIGSLFYTLFPYHLFDIYKRGSIGEALSLSILPFILWQIERKDLLLISLGVGLLILSHNSLALLFIPLILVYIYLRNKKITRFDLLTFFFGFGISAFFWVPALYDTRYTVFADTKVSDFSSYFIDNNLVLLGFISAFLLLESVFYLIKRRDKFYLILFLTFSVISLFTLSFSESIWRLIPFTNLIQFPFRLISLLIPLGAFMIAYLLSKENLARKYFLVLLYFILIFLSSFEFLTPKSYQFHPESFYSTNQDTTTVRNEYMPKQVKEIPVNFNPERVEIIGGQEKINIESISPNKIVFDTYLPVDRKVRVNIVYFPGWVSFVNNEKRELGYDNKSGLMTLDLKKGQNNVEIFFTETLVRLLSDFISIISLISLFIFYYLLRKKKIKL